MGSAGGGRPARPGGRLPVAEVAIIKLVRHLTGILQCFSSPSCYKTKTSRRRSHITYDAHLTHFLFAHIVAEVCDVLALVIIATGFRKPVAAFVAGAAQHR